MLVGTLGRPALGQMIEERGYYDVFLLTTGIGGFAGAFFGLYVFDGRAAGTAQVFMRCVKNALGIG